MFELFQRSEFEVVITQTLIQQYKKNTKYDIREILITG